MRDLWQSRGGLPMQRPSSVTLSFWAVLALLSAEPATAGGPESPYADDTDTVALWHFDGNGDNAASEASPTAVVMLRPGAAFAASGGRFGGCLEIGNAGAFVDDAAIPELDDAIAGAKDFTIEAWVWPDPSDVDGSRVTTGILEHYKGDDGAGAFRRGFDWRIDNLAAGVAGRPSDAKGLPFFRSGDVPCICTSTSAVVGLFSGGGGSELALTAGAWNHVAVCRRGDEWTQWVNGTLVSSVTTPPGRELPDSDQPLIFGAVETFMRPMSGRIDEVRVSRVARYTPPPPPDPCASISPPNGTHLFLDDCEIASMTGLQRVFHPAVKRGVVKGNEMPWETGSGGNYVQVFKEGGTFHMYYAAIHWDSSAGPPDDPSQHYRCHVCYATSADGLTWVRPVIGRLALPASSTGGWNGRMEPVGSTFENNALFEGQQTTGYYDAKRRTGKKILINFSGHFFAGSDDWTSFTSVGACPPRCNMFGLLYNEEDGIWEGFTQGVFGAEFPRMIGRHYSSDFYNWTSHAALSPDDEDHQLPTDYDEYMSMSVRRTPGLTIGFNNVFHGDRTDIRYMSPGFYAWRKGTVEPQLVCSRDGRNWTHLGDRQPWIPHGPEEHSYDRLVMLSNGGVRVGRELWFYYEAWDGDHLTYDAYGECYYPDGRIREGRVALATIRLDGYVSLRGDAAEGELTTKPLTLATDRLYVNADADAGEVRVELLDEAGQVIPGWGRADCDALTTDDVEAPMCWGGRWSLQALGGQTIRLRFVVRNADLYSFTLATAPGDLDADGDVDLDDFTTFQACFNGPNRPCAQPDCDEADEDHDSDVDLADFLTFQGCFNGPNRPPACP